MLALPSFDDEEKLYPGTSLAQVMDRIAALGAPEIVLKNGSIGPLIRAGDSFNARYLAARLAGAAPEAAATARRRLASHVIARPGGVIPKSAIPLKEYQPGQTHG